MRKILQVLSVIGLIVTIAPSILVFYDIITLATSKTLMIFGTLLWFGSAPFWMNKKI
jgi:hypothetical protein